MSCNVVVPKRIFVVLIALTFLTGIYAAAQVTVQPINEIYLGYAWLHPNGNVDWGKVPDITHGGDASITHYFPQAHNLGAIFDGSYHSGSQGPLNASVNPLLGGLQWKLHSQQLSPFLRVMGGAAHLLPEQLRSEWKPAVDVGGGLDLNVAKRFAIRMAQFDYIWTYYREDNAQHTSSNWNMIRLSAGLVANLGSYYNPPLTCTATGSTSEVFAPDPVKVSTTGAGFNPKHPIAYSWTTTGGKMSDASAQNSTVDTTGVAPGTYAANSTITDTWPKFKNLDSGHHLNLFGKPDPIPPAKCAANFTVKQPQPPQVSCAANPTTIAIGEPSTVTMTATDPQGWPMTYSWTSDGGQLTPNGTSATLTAGNADAGKTITVTGTATTNRPGGNPETLSSNCTASVTVPAVQKCVMIEDRGECTFEKNPKKPWRVDNDCKDTLDRLALQLQQMPNGKLDIVGYTDEKETVSEQTLGGQRSVNAKYYLTTEGPTKIDQSKIQPRAGGQGTKSTHFYFVPEGTLCGGQAEIGTTVDESQVQPQGRNAAPKKKAKKAKPAPAPAQ
jgi:outer membrane protein OmpA-like peptidoglycan-associated protein